VTISVIHCFDHNYVLPAAVAFRTLLEHAKTPNAVYDLHVLGSGITEADRALLQKAVAEYPKARLTFKTPPPNPIPADVLPEKGHYSSDLYYKLMVPELYPELGRAVLADVDVVWEDDVAKVWNALNNQQPATGNQQPTPLIAGAWDPGYAAYHREGLFPTGRPLIRKYARKFSSDELEKLRISAGLMVFDLAGLRREGMAAKWIDFARANAHRAILPEQEPINIVSHDHIVTLPHPFMADAGSAEHPRWREVFCPTMVLHFASREKPWKYPGAPLAERWFAACARAGLVEEWRKFYADWSRPLAAWSLAKHLLDGSVRLGHRQYGFHVVKA